MKKGTSLAAAATLAASILLIVPSASAQNVVHTYNTLVRTFRSDVTVTATGVETEAHEVPAPTTVITRQQIDDSQAESVADLLRRVPGLTVMRTGTEGGETSVFTRGTDGKHTLVLFDGIRLNSPAVGGYDFSQLATTGLDRIEVARGPYSPLWGADAVGGVVNVIPATGREGYGVGFFLEGGEHGWRRYQGTVNLGSKRFGLFAAGLHREGNGEVENADFELRDIVVDASWTWGDKGRLALVYQDVDAKTGIPFAVTGEPSPERRQRSQQRLAAIPLRFGLAKWWTVELMGGKIEREFSFEDPEDQPGPTTTETLADTSQARLANHHELGSHTLSWGGEWREDEVTGTVDFAPILVDEKRRVTSGFVQDLWQAGERLRLLFGARWDNTDQWGSQLSPRVNLGWSLSEKLELRASYGEAFREPSLGELYLPVYGNPELEPETSRSYEIGLAHTALRARRRWQLNLFATDLRSLIEVGIASGKNQNLGEAEIRGVELVHESALTDDFLQLIQITYLDAKNDEGEPLLWRPEWSGSYTLTGSFWPDVRGMFTVEYVGSRDDLRSLDRVRNGSYTVVHTSVGWQAWKGGEITLRVINLFDTRYEERLGYPSPRRRLMAGVRFVL